MVGFLKHIHNYQDTKSQQNKIKKLLKINFKNKVTGADNMNADREYFYELVDKIPEEKLEELRIVLLKMAIPEVEATEEELEAIRKGKEEIERGEFTRYATFEEMERYFMND